MQAHRKQPSSWTVMSNTDKHKSEVNVGIPKLPPGQGVTHSPNTLGALCNHPKKLCLLCDISKLFSFSNAPHRLLRTKCGIRALPCYGTYPAPFSVLHVLVTCLLSIVTVKPFPKPFINQLTTPQCPCFKLMNSLLWH